MSTLTQYKKEIRNMFFISVKKDLKEWQDDAWSSKSYFIDNNEFYFFYIDTDSDFDRGQTLYLKNSYRNKEKIVRYAWWFIILDFKVWWYVIKLKKHFKKIKNDKKDMIKIEYFKSGLNAFEKNFQKEVRKQKLDKINK